MILYHGSNCVVRNLEIRKSNRFLDFGNGFYTTTNLDQATNFAKKVAKRINQDNCFVSVYSFDDSRINDLKILSFNSPDEKWLDFVSNNRNGTSLNNNYDLIYGPVADDDVYRTFSLFASGLLNKDQTLAFLKVKKLYNQYVFVSNKSLKHLFFKKYFEVK